MSLLKKIKRLAGFPDISQKALREFIATVGPVAVPVLPQDQALSLTVVVPCYCHASFLKTMLKSITSQTCMPDEVIFVDDCSPDKSGEVLAKLLADMSESERHLYRVIVNSSNLGQSASINLAVENAQSDLVMILNDDDYLMHDAVDVALKLFKRYPEVMLIGGTSIHFKTDKELLEADMSIADIVNVSNLELDIRQPSDALLYKNYNDLNITHTGSCFRKAAWEAVGKYYSDKAKRVVPFSDRDFQLRVNALFQVGVSSSIPFSFWRSNSSVDNGLDS